MPIFENRVVIREALPKNEKHVDYNGRPLSMLGCITVDLVEVGKQTMRGAGIVILRDEKKSPIHRYWLTKFNYRLTEA